MPRGKDKRRLYEVSRDFLLGKGYVEIGMDHFALPGDSLSKVIQGVGCIETLWVMWKKRTEVLLGLGVSAISETPDCFHQNEKVLPIYERRIFQGRFPL